MEKPATVVLVHAAWHGGWCWNKVVPLLRAAGHEVLTPTPTGLGERAHLLTPQVGLDTHVADVSAVLEYEDFAGVVLVGHSCAGMVIAGAAQRVAARPAGLVCLDAFLPEDGKAVSDLAPLAPARDDGWRVLSLRPPAAFGVTDERDAAWMASRLGDHPLRSFTQPLSLSAGETGAVWNAYIRCSCAPFSVEAGRRARQQGLRYEELSAADHDAMITHPDAPARVLISLAQPAVSRPRRAGRSPDRRGTTASR
ncbi:MAG: alpha/beta fold hydrolase [Isosphaeraceae bacterium]|nr:alpha/beta fold hydrolase [Isosphaeraceae bacterium]